MNLRHRPTATRRARTRLRVAAVLATAAVVAALAYIPVADAATQSHVERLVFDGGGDTLNGVTYHSFRIPSLVRTKANTLLAFAEGRVSNAKDYGNINLVYKRSTDNGSGWSSLRQVAGVGQGTWGNPTAVVDQDTGTVWLFMSWCDEGFAAGDDPGMTPITKWEHRRVFLSRSDDDGVTFSRPVDMTEQVKPKLRANGTEWARDGVGPGVGIQTSTGRLVVPALYRNIYSDDHGATWKVQKVAEESTEGTVLETSDGKLMRNDRATTGNWESAKRRWVARGTIEGGFGAYAPDQALLDPGSEGSIMRYNNGSPSRVIFLNSASTVNRQNMTFRISYDEGRTWRYSRKAGDAPLPHWGALGSGTVREGGYSSIARTADFHVGALIEVNEDVPAKSDAHRSIVLRKVNLPWLLNGRSE